MVSCLVLEVLQKRKFLFPHLWVLLYHRSHSQWKWRPSQPRKKNQYSVTTINISFYDSRHSKVNRNEDSSSWVILITFCSPHLIAFVIIEWITLFSTDVNVAAVWVLLFFKDIFWVRCDFYLFLRRK